MERELSEVQRRFASVPLFDRALAHELAALERRHVTPASSDFHGGLSTGTGERVNRFADPISFDGPEDLSSPSPTPGRGANYRPQRAAGPATTFRLPEKIQRPWSVEVLLHRGDAIIQSQQHPQAHRFLRYPSEDQQVTHSFDNGPMIRRGPSSAASPSRFDQYHAGNDADVSPYQSARHSRSPSSRSHRKKKAPPVAGSGLRFHRSSDAFLGLTAQAMRDEQSTEDDEYHKPDLLALEEMLRSGATEPSSHNVSAGSSQLLQQATRATTIQVNLDLNEETVEAQIERAAVRHRLRKDRLHAAKKHAPDEVEAAAVQTDPQITHLVPDNIGVEKEKKKKSFGTQSEGGSATSRAAANTELAKHRSEGLVLAPQVAYTPVTLQTTLREDDTVWRKLALQEAHPELKQHAGAARETALSSSNAQTFRSDAGTHRGDTASNGGGIGASSSLADAKVKLLNQLDRMQLDHEEMLVRNKVIDSSTRSIDAGENRLIKGAIAHVSSAHKPEVEAPKLGPPQGGYGSIEDSSPIPSYLGIPPPGSAPSWASIRQQNDHDASSALTVEPLRRWATDLAATRHEPVATVFPSSRSSLKSSASTINQAVEYNARRKWQNVSFATAQQNQQELPPGLLDNISTQAKSMMTPS